MMATKSGKNASGERGISAAEVLAQAVGQHVETLTDAEGFAVKVARVALVEQAGVIVAQPLGGYRLRTVDREWIEQAVKAAHALRKIGE